MVAALWAACAVLLCSMACSTLWDVDFWWQLATGDWIRTHGIMRTEQFTQDHAGTPRIESSWLYCVAIDMAVDAVGVSGAIALKAVAWIIAFASVALVRPRERSNPWGRLLAPAVVALAAVASSLRFGVRPEAVSAALLGITLLALERHRAGSRWWLVVPPLAQLIWVNVHSYWPLGLLCIAVYGAAESRGDGRGRAWVACMAGAGLALLCNPYGVAMLALPLHQFGVMTAGGSAWAMACIVAVALAAMRVTSGRAFGRTLREEWMPVRRRLAPVIIAVGLGALWISPIARTIVAALLPTPAAGGERSSITELASAFAVSTDVPSIAAFKALASLALVCVVAAPARRDRPLAMVVAGGFVLAAMSVRNLPLFCIPAAAYVSVAIGRLVPAMRAVPVHAKDRRLAAWALAAVSVAAMLHWSRETLTNRLWLRQGVPCRSGLGVEPFQFADGACDFLRRIGFDGRLFNSHAQGGRLIAAGVRVFIDPRAVEGSLGEYVAMMRDPVVTGSRLAERFDVAVLDAMDASLISPLILRGWRVCFFDPAAAVLLRPGYRDDVATIDPADPALLATIRERIGPVTPHAEARFWTQLSSPHPSLRMSRLLGAMGRTGEARTFFDEAVSAAPPDVAARIR